MKIKSLSKPLKEAASEYNTAKQILKGTGLSTYYVADTTNGENIMGVLQDRAALQVILNFIREHKEHLNKIQAEIRLIADLYWKDEVGLTYTPGSLVMEFAGYNPVERRVSGRNEYCVSAIKNELAKLEQELNGKDSNKRTGKPKIMVTGAWGGSYVGGGEYEGGRYYFEPFEVEDTDDGTLYTGLVENIPDPEEAATLDYVDKLIVYTSVGDFTLEDY